jgi:insertion element IS1 protein InsB
VLSWYNNLGLVIIQDHAFLQLKTLLEPFGIMQFYTDDWGGLCWRSLPEALRHIDLAFRPVGKRHTQQIERQHLTLRTRIKRLARKTICFSKSEWLHDVVIGLFINHYEFG